MLEGIPEEDRATGVKLEDSELSSFKTGGTGEGHNRQDKESAFDILNAYACVERKAYQIENKAQDFQYERDVRPSVRLGDQE